VTAGAQEARQPGEPWRPGPGVRGPSLALSRRLAPGATSGRGPDADPQRGRDGDPGGHLRLAVLTADGPRLQRHSAAVTVVPVLEVAPIWARVPLAAGGSNQVQLP